MSIGGTLAVKCAVGAGRDGGVGGGVKMMRAHNINCDTVQKENNMLKKKERKTLQEHTSVHPSSREGKVPRDRLDQAWYLAKEAPEVQGGEKPLPN